MNIALSHNSITIRINSDLIAFVFDDGVGVYVSLCIEPINIRQLGGALIDIIPDPAAGYGTTTILVGNTYSSIKSALTGFAELAHPTFTNILINADKVARILDNGSEREILFDTYNRCISSDSASDIATAIEAALLAGGSGITQLTGDVTAGPGSGSQAATIANDSVTYAKMQNTSTDSILLGRGRSVGAGDVQEITLGTGLSMSGTTLSASGGGGAGSLQVTSALSTTLQQVKDGSSNNSTLWLATDKLSIVGTSASTGDALLVQNSTPENVLRVGNNGAIDIGTNAAATTQTTGSVNVTGSGTNIGVALVPKGTGAFTLAIPTGTSNGGNARGANSTDLQTFRGSASQVASGDYSFAAGRANIASNTGCVAAGEYNTASGSRSVSMGLSNTASGSYALAIGFTNSAAGSRSVAFGSRSTSPNDGQLSFGGYNQDNLVTGYVSQGSMYTQTRQITGTSITELFNDAGSSRAVIPLPTGATAGRVWNAHIQISAVCNLVGDGTGTLGDAFVATYNCGIKRIGSTTSLIGTVQTVMTPQADTSMSTSVVTIDANNTNEALRIQFTPPSTAGSTSRYRINATVILSEIGY